MAVNWPPPPSSARLYPAETIVLVPVTARLPPALPARIVLASETTIAPLPPITTPCPPFPAIVALRIEAPLPATANPTRTPWRLFPLTVEFSIVSVVATPNVSKATAAPLGLVLVLALKVQPTRVALASPT